MNEMNATVASVRERELEVAREIAHAFMAAATPLELYRLALARLTPLVRASFSSVFLRDPHDPTLLKLACAHNWPQSSARYLGDLRVRVGRGPTGKAVAESMPFHVHDVFADAALREWWEPARELGFKSFISLPLRTADEASGALTFYFAEAHELNRDDTHLLVLIADQLAVTGARAESVVTLRRDLEQMRVERDRLIARASETEDARRMKEEFLSNISHELRTPLTSIMGYTDLLTSGAVGELDAEQRTAVGRIESSAQVLMRLISDLLELSEVRLGRSALNMAPEDAVMIARRALDEAGAPPAGVQLQFEPGTQRLPLLTDGEKATKVLVNLLTNAYKFTSQGSVTLSVRAVRDETNSAIEWVVRDTGIGIPPNQQAAIFDEFRQVDGSSTRLYGGTGMGLALSRALTVLLGGRLQLSSAEGSGSEFRFVVPTA
jgi:signal transduction histidine kinase